MVELVLASQSPTRIAMLNAAGIAFTAIPAPLDERAVEAPLIEAGAGAMAIAEALAAAKAVAVGRQLTEAIVIGADQTLELEGEHFVKPATMAEAREHLARLSGRTHTLQTAVAAVHRGNVVWRHSEAPKLTMRPLTAAAIDAYLDKVGNAALSSVGAYQIEGPAIQLFDAIEGDYFTILGLPLLPLLRFLRGEGAIA
jgi:septum formation protein